MPRQPKTSLPVVGSTTRKRARRSILTHACRVFLLFLAVLGLHRSYAHSVAKNRKPIENESILVFAKQIWSTAERCLANIHDATITDVVDSSDIILGHVATTSPVADSIVGYAGPSNLLIAISTAGLVQRVSIARSADTAEHVLKVQNDAPFWKQFEGISWSNHEGQTHSTMPTHPDGVSGATLTSLAMAESILVRIESSHQGNSPATEATTDRTSLKFSQPLTMEEASEFAFQTAKQFPENWNTEQIEVKLTSNWEASICTKDGVALGSVVRSGPLADHIVGYQGPTELLICLNADRELMAATFRSTFDNEPYSRYVRDEAGFWSKFEGQSVTRIANLDLKLEGIEGVSGATMTSIAVAETLQASCKQLVQLWEKEESTHLVQGTPNPKRMRRWNFSMAEVFTIMMACCAIPWSVSRWRGRKVHRAIWQAASFVGLGWISGNLLSLTLFSSWTQGGIPWLLAPGLAVLLIVTFLSCVLFKRNVYCDHLCPHGIAQQWLRNLPRPSWLRNLDVDNLLQALNLTSIGAILFVVAALLLGRAVPTAWLEPFDTYAWRVGVTWSALTWLLSLSISYIRPMAYCRHGCPTGKVLNYTRFDPTRWKILPADFFLIALLLVWFV